MATSILTVASSSTPSTSLGPYIKISSTTGELSPSSASFRDDLLKTPTTSAPGLFQFGSRSPAMSPERIGGHDGDGTITPASSWWAHRINSPRPWEENPKRKRSIPVEQAEGYAHARSVCLFPLTFLPVFLIRSSLAGDRGHRGRPRCGGKLRPRGTLFWSRPLAIYSRSWIGTCW